MAKKTTRTRLHRTQSRVAFLGLIFSLTMGIQFKLVFLDGSGINLFTVLFGFVWFLCVPVSCVGMLLWGFAGDRFDRLDESTRAKWVFATFVPFLLAMLVILFFALLTPFTNDPGTLSL